MGVGDVTYPSNKMTVILRDDSPMIHCGDSPSYRTVSIELTPEQVVKIGLKWRGTTGANVNIYESISRVIIDMNDPF